MSITSEVKKELISKFKLGKADTGSVEVQVALLTERINNLTSHLKTHRKDFISTRGLLVLVGRRRNFLSYIKRKNHDRYSKLLEQLGLRK